MSLIRRDLKSKDFNCSHIYQTSPPETSHPNSDG